MYIYIIQTRIHIHIYIHTYVATRFFFFSPLLLPENGWLKLSSGPTPFQVTFSPQVTFIGAWQGSKEGHRLMVFDDGLASKWMV